MSVYYSSNENGYFHNDFHGDMTNPVSKCNRFERRHDFDTFNMSNYMSCENCRHLSAENKCIAGNSTHFGRME
ncbi:MAG: hypothetical protein ACK5MV_11175 [Aminipila sp.]